jgi:HPt (histidine-containing phosphotransfer) domain-containing protein
VTSTAFDSFNELDDEIKQEFYEDVAASVKDINECAVLLEGGTDAQVIDQMFRALHTIKGNCNMVFLTPFVAASHKLEDFFSDIRCGDFEYNEHFGQLAVVVVNAISAELNSLIISRQANIEVLKQLEKIIDTLEKSPADQRLIVAEKAIIAIQDGHYNLDIVALAQENSNAFSFLDATDLEFFQFISDKQSIVDPGHSTLINICDTLAKKLNRLLANSVEEQQLTTAIIFVILTKRFSFDENSIELSLDHLFIASGILSRMAGWSIAAELVLELKENHDGSGIPLGLKDEKIKPAAQALALSFEFTFIVMENLSQGYKQSLFTAVKTINAKKGTQYKARLIERFNGLIKSEYLTTQMW